VGTDVLGRQRKSNDFQQDESAWENPFKNNDANVLLTLTIKSFENIHFMHSINFLIHKQILQK
jgi:hypothetical protein